MRTQSGVGVFLLGCRNLSHTKTPIEEKEEEEEGVGGGAFSSRVLPARVSLSLTFGLLFERESGEGLDGAVGFATSTNAYGPRFFLVFVSPNSLTEFCITRLRDFVVSVCVLRFGKRVS